jgi:large subunit ribosomal protein L23
MKPASDIISRPILTEKASGLAEANKYVFEILPGADRAQVKTAIEAAFKVTVQKVNILVRKGKVRRSRLGGGAIYTETVSRRAIVTLKKGDVISLA